MVGAFLRRTSSSIAEGRLVRPQAARWGPPPSSGSSSEPRGTTAPRSGRVSGRRAGRRSDRRTGGAHDSFACGGDSRAVHSGTQYVPAANRSRQWSVSAGTSCVERAGGHDDRLYHSVGLLWETSAGRALKPGRPGSVGGTALAWSRIAARGGRPTGWRRARHIAPGKRARHNAPVARQAGDHTERRGGA